MLVRIFTLEFNVPQVHGFFVEPCTSQQCNPRRLVPMLPTVSDVGSREQMCEKALLRADTLHFLAETEQTLLQ